MNHPSPIPTNAEQRREFYGRKAFAIAGSEYGSLWEDLSKLRRECYRRIGTGIADLVEANCASDHAEAKRLLEVEREITRKAVEERDHWSSEANGLRTLCDLAVKRSVEFRNAISYWRAGQTGQLDATSNSPSVVLNELLDATSDLSSKVLVDRAEWERMVKNTCDALRNREDGK